MIGAGRPHGKILVAPKAGWEEHPEVERLGPNRAEVGFRVKCGLVVEGPCRLHVKEPRVLERLPVCRGETKRAVDKSR